MTQTDVPDATEDGPVLLQVLTDVELAVLGAADGTVVTPFLDSIDEIHHDAVSRTAFRSLLARGLIDMPTDEAMEASRAAGPDAPIEITVREDVVAIINLRLGAQAMLAVARTTDVGQDFWYAHVVDDVALLEEVGSDGLHRYVAVDKAGLPDLLVDAVVLPDAVDGTGSPVSFEASDPTPPAELLQDLGEGYIRCDVILRRRGDEGAPLLGAFTGPRGSWMVEAHADEGATLLASPASVDDLRARLRDLAGQAARGAAR